MSEWKDEIRQAFEQARWEEQSVELPHKVESFAGLFSGSFAICAVASSQSSDQVIESWAELQGALAELKSDGSLAKSKDLYLLFVVESVEESTLGDLQNILDDTRVCRKICLERRSRNLAETLADVPFFTTPGLPPVDDNSTSEIFDAIMQLPEAIQSDLERRSADYILGKLVNGEYEVG